MYLLKNRSDRYYLLFLGLAFATLVFGVGDYGLAETSEARYAEISREMFLNGDYLNPELLGVFHYHKPPLTYYITTAGYRIFGINELGARFFLQLAVVIQLLLIYGIALQITKSRKTAFLSGLVYFSMPVVLMASRNLTTDLYLTTFIMAAIYCWQYYNIKKRVLMLYVFYILTGLTLLTKGPVGLLFILVYIITYKIIFKERWAPGLHHFAGILLCLVIGSSWYVLVLREHVELLDYFFNTQLVSRITSKSFHRDKPFWFYLPILVGLLFPWWLSLIPGLRRKILSFSALKPESKVVLSAALILFLMFSLFKTKLIFYILPAFWMVSIFIATQADFINKYAGRMVSLAFLVLIILFSGVLLYFRLIDPDVVSITGSEIAIAFLAMSGGILIYFFARRFYPYKPFVMASVFGAYLLLISPEFMEVNYSLINSGKDIVRYIDTLPQQGHRTILVYDYLLSSIPFYTRDELVTLKYEHNTTARETQFETDNSFRRYLWDVHDPGEVKKLDSITRERSTYLLVRDKWPLNTELEFVKDNFDAQKHFKKWTLYYHR